MGGTVLSREDRTQAELVAERAARESGETQAVVQDGRHTFLVMPHSMAATYVEMRERDGGRRVRILLASLAPRGNGA